MDDKEVQDLNLHNEQETSRSKEGIELNDTSWLFCPVCGKKIPKIHKLKFCMSCGINLDYLKEHRTLQQENVINPYIKPLKYPQPYTPPISYGPKKISDDEIIDTKNHELWGTTTSIGVPLGAFLLMNFLTAGILVIIIYASFDLELLYEILLNPYFLIKIQLWKID